MVEIVDNVIIHYYAINFEELKMALEKLKQALSGDLRDNKSIPFWSWNNALDEKELVKQIEDMYAAGIS